MARARAKRHDIGCTRIASRFERNAPPPPPPKILQEIISQSQKALGASDKASNSVGSHRPITKFLR